MWSPTECAADQLRPRALSVEERRAVVDKGQRPGGPSSNMLPLRGEELAVRYDVAVNEDADFELDQVGMLAEGAHELADLGGPPAVDGDLERRAGLETRDEARHHREAEGALRVSELHIVNDVARDLELLHGHLGLAARWEEEDVPVLVPHDWIVRAGVGRGVCERCLRGVCEKGAG